MNPSLNSVHISKASSFYLFVSLFSFYTVDFNIWMSVSTLLLRFETHIEILYLSVYISHLFLSFLWVCFHFTPFLNFLISLFSFHTVDTSPVSHSSTIHYVYIETTVLYFLFDTFKFISTFCVFVHLNHLFFKICLIKHWFIR